MAIRKPVFSVRQSLKALEDAVAKAAEAALDAALGDNGMPSADRAPLSAAADALVEASRSLVWLRWSLGERDRRNGRRLARQIAEANERGYEEGFDDGASNGVVDAGTAADRRLDQLSDVTNLSKWSDGYVRRLGVLEHCGEVLELHRAEARAKARGSSGKYEPALRRELADLWVVLEMARRADPEFASLCGERTMKFRP